LYAVWNIEQRVRVSAASRIGRMAAAAAAMVGAMKLVTSGFFWKTFCSEEPSDPNITKQPLFSKAPSGCSRSTSFNGFIKSAYNFSNQTLFLLANTSLCCLAVDFSLQDP